jgi:alcohol dehydrogenase YqhD (iron-dependent ADH family)
LLVYGNGSIKNNGVYSKVIQELKDSNITYSELTGIIPNPLLSRVREGIELCRKRNIGFVLAVGGGSVIDTVKGIVNGVFYNGDVWDFYAHSNTPGQALPFGTVVTIPASGSEMSYSSVITHDELCLKRGFNSITNVPKFSILNPEYTFSLPAYQTACGCTDIMAHMIERYFTTEEYVDFSDRLIEGGLRSILQNAPIVLASPENYNARAEIMWASTIAHNTLLQMGRGIGDWASHNIEHELSAEYNIAHGAGLAIILPAWMKYVWKSNPQRFVQFASRVLDVDYALAMEEEIVMEGIRRLEFFFKRIGMPIRLNEAGIDSDRLEKLANRAAPTPKVTLGNFVKLKSEDILAIYKLAL